MPVPILADRFTAMWQLEQQDVLGLIAVLKVSHNIAEFQSDLIKALIHKDPQVGLAMLTVRRLGGLKAAASFVIAALAEERA